MYTVFSCTQYVRYGGRFLSDTVTVSSSLSGRTSARKHQDPSTLGVEMWTIH